MPSWLVVGTQKGGTSSLHYMLKSNWHADIHINQGEGEGEGVGVGEGER